MASSTLSLQLDGDTILTDIQLSNSLPVAPSLRFLSIVDTRRLPLHLILGRPCDVSTSTPNTASWFSNILRDVESHDGAHWWQTARPDSPAGILAATEIEYGKSHHGPRVTELLFYASVCCPRDRAGSSPPPSPIHESSCAQDSALTVHALALSSDLACSYAEPTPPSSPSRTIEDDIEATFLPSTFEYLDEQIHRPPVKKRRTANDAFDEAAERRKRARRKGGEGVSAASDANQTPVPALAHRRSVSGSVPLQTRPLSRSASVASSSRPASMRGAASFATEKRSGLSRVQRVSAPPLPPSDQAQTVEQKNRDVIARIVMAGMRLYGLAQSKMRKDRADSTIAASPDNVETSLDQQQQQREVEKQKDEEYKLIYHQVFKGACFAFRQHIGVEQLQNHADATRETVDRLLALYCTNPLAQTVGAAAGAEQSEETPGGRKAFGSARMEDKSPFPAPAARVDAITPSFRKLKEKVK